MLKISSEVVAQPVGDQLILLDLHGNAYFSLNASARFMFERLSQGLSPDSIVDEAARTFAATPEQLASDLSELIEALKSYHLVEADAM